MDRWMLSLAIVIAVSMCLPQGHSNTIVGGGSFEDLGDDGVVEDSQTLIEDELLFEINGGEGANIKDDDDDDDDDDDAAEGVSGFLKVYVSDNGDIYQQNSSSEVPHRVRRTTFRTDNLMWTHRIPYVMDFTQTERRFRLRKVLDHLEDLLCVKFINVEAKLDPSNTNWLKDSGFKTKSYMYYNTGRGCSALYGQGQRGPRKISPCYAYISMLHETLHALGGQHAQKFPLRDRYLTLHNGNIYEGKRKQYSKTPIQDRINFEFFDSASIILYGNHFFSSGGPTYDFLRPEMGHLSGMRSTKTLMYEMTQNYKCAETYCSHVTRNCGPGYLTFLHDKCVCVCPDYYNPATNCTTLIDKVEGPASWPNTPFSMYKASDDLCPDGFEEGTILIKGKRTPVQTGVPLPVNGKTLELKVCTRTTPTPKQNWETWPLGSYCIGKVTGVACTLPFEDTSFRMKIFGNAKSLIGAVGDVTIDGKYVIMRLCCNDQAATRITIPLPTARPFRLVMASETCQEVNGMFSVPTTIKTQTLTKISGFKPEHEIRKNYFTHTSCLYIPPVYGCNQEMTLTPDQPRVTFSIPTKNFVRESSRRCFFAFKAPDESRLRLNFDEFSIHPKDKFYVKRFHPWTNHFQVHADSRPGQMITERNYLFVEFWSYHEDDDQYTGAQLSVDLLLDSDMCYPAQTHGADYAGSKDVTELYEDCVAWKDATSCPDFPWEYSLTLFNSENKCRNQDSREMIQPWCYSHVEGPVCIRRYCDVCNEADSRDLVSGCQTELSTNPDACQNTFFKNNCYKSCGQSTQPYDANAVKCSKPEIPSEVIANEVLQDSYDVGSEVSVTCQGQVRKIECTRLGWTPFDGKCTDECIDASQLCQNALTSFPEFCTHAKSRDIAIQNCKKSCGLCQSGTCVVSDDANYVTSPSVDQIATGQSVTFSCSNGQAHVTGDLTRACSVTGSLLGDEPICQAGNRPVDININGIRDSFTTDKFRSRMALLMLNQDLRIPFDGTITRWFYYCRDNEDIQLLVYRVTSDPKIFHRVGSNHATCAKGRPSTHWVPQEQQILVKEGDIIGVYQSTVSFAHIECKGDVYPIAMTKKADWTDLLKTTETYFHHSLCLRVPFGAHVQPST